MSSVRMDLEGVIGQSFWIGPNEIYAPAYGKRYQLPYENGILTIKLISNTLYPTWDAQKTYYNNIIVQYSGNFWIADYGGVFTGQQPEISPNYWSPYAFPTYPDDGVGLLGEIKVWHKNLFATVQTPLITGTTASTGGTISGNLKDNSRTFSGTKVSTGMLHINYNSGNAGLFANVNAIVDANNLAITSVVKTGNDAPYKLYNTPKLHPSWLECNGQVCTTNGSPFYGKTLPNLNQSPTGEKTPGQTLYSDNSATNRPMYLHGSTAAGSFAELAGRAKQATEAYNFGTFSVVYIMRVML